MDDVVDRKNPPPGQRPPEHFYGRVLKPAELLEHARYSVVPVVEEQLRPWVKRIWAVDWDLPRGVRYQTATVSEPTINLTVEYGDIRRANTDGAGTWVTGPVTKKRFDVGIFGRGGVFGVNFHLGGTLAFSSQSPASVRDTSVPAGTWFPGIDESLGLENELSRGATSDAAAKVIESWLLSFRPRLTESYRRFREVMELLDDPAVVSLGELSSRSEMSERSLQRMFDEYCGVGVKRLLTRARIIDAVAALDSGWDGTLADLGVSLGWFDQSHFTTDFRRTTGYTPTEYLSAHDRRSQPSP